MGTKKVVIEQTRGIKLLFLTSLYLTIFTILMIFSISASAEYNLYGCSCIVKQNGSQGTCGNGQGCTNALENIGGLYCHANPAGGFPLNSCGEGCLCRSDSDCSRIAFAGKCIENHCYSPVNGIFVNPLACPQRNARR